MSWRERAEQARKTDVDLRLGGTELLEVLALVEVADMALAELEPDPPPEVPDAPWWWGEDALCYQDARGILRAGKRSTYTEGTPVDPRHPGEEVPILGAIAWALSPQYTPSPGDSALTVHQRRFMGDYDPNLHPTEQPGARKGAAPEWW